MKIFFGYFNNYWTMKFVARVECDIYQASEACYSIFCTYACKFCDLTSVKAKARVANTRTLTNISGASRIQEVTFSRCQQLCNKWPSINYITQREETRVTDKDFPLHIYDIISVRSQNVLTFLKQFKWILKRIKRHNDFIN